MALKDLIIDQKQISEELLEKLLKGKVDLVKENQAVSLTKFGNSLPNKTRILLFLCSKKAWEFLTKKEIKTSIEELEKNLGIRGNTIRPILKELRDSYQVESEKGKYRILPKGIFTLGKELEQQGNKEEKGEERRGVKIQKKEKSGKGFSRSEFINKLYGEGFFKEPKTLEEAKNELEKMGVATKLSSLPPYFLPLVRKGKLNREKIQKGKKKIWVYKSNI